MRAGPSAPSPPRRGSSALAPITIQDDYEAPDYADPYHDHPQAYQNPLDYQHEQYAAAVPLRPPPRTHHSLPMATSTSSAASPSPSSSTSLDPRVVRSERSTPLAANTGLSAKLGVKLKRGRDQHQTGQEGYPESGGRDFADQGEEREVKLNDTISGRRSDDDQAHAGWANQSNALDHVIYDALSTSNLATLNRTPTKKKPGRPRGWRELASINPTPLPLTPKKLRNGRVRDRSRDSSASEGSSSEEEEEGDRQREVCHEVYRPQYRLARPYRRRLPGADAENGRKARPAKERSLKTSPPADSAEETAASSPAQLAITPAWTKPWILNKCGGDEENDAVPSYPEVHYFVRWMHDAYHARQSAAGQAGLMEQWGLSSLPPNSQEEAKKQHSPVQDESRAVDTSSKRRDAQDDEDDAAVACLLFSDEAGQPSEARLEASPVPPFASPALVEHPGVHVRRTSSPSATATPAITTLPPPPAADPAVTSPPLAPSALWLATIATRISILDTPEVLLPAHARGTQQDYPLLLREQFSVRAGARRKDESGGASQDVKQAEEQPAGAAVAAAAASPLEDLHRVCVALPTSAQRGRRGGRRVFPSSLETKPLWEHFVARYRSRRAQGCSHEEALWCGPPLSPRAEGAETEVGEDKGEGEGQEAAELEMKMGRGRGKVPPLILRRNLPKERRAD